jgi:hypothetical protein
VPGQLTPASGIEPHAALTRKRRSEKEGWDQASRAQRNSVFMRRPNDESVLFLSGGKARRDLRLRFFDGVSRFLDPRPCRARLTDVGRPGLGSATMTTPITPRIN